MTNSRLALVVIGLLATACTAVRPAPDSGTVASAWVEIGPGGSAQVRAIT